VWTRTKPGVDGSTDAASVFPASQTTACGIPPRAAGVHGSTRPRCAGEQRGHDLRELATHQVLTASGKARNKQVHTQQPHDEVSTNRACHAGDPHTTALITPA